VTPASELLGGTHEPNSLHVQPVGHSLDDKQLADPDPTPASPANPLPPPTEFPALPAEQPDAPSAAAATSADQMTDVCMRPPRPHAFATHVPHAPQRNRRVTARDFQTRRPNRDKNVRADPKT
jgi:hypothetical protein